MKWYSIALYNDTELMKIFTVQAKTRYAALNQWINDMTLNNQDEYIKLINRTRELRICEE